MYGQIVPSTGMTRNSNPIRHRLWWVILKRVRDRYPEIGCLQVAGTIFVWAALRCHFTDTSKLKHITSPVRLEPSNYRQSETRSPFAKALKARILTDIRHTTREQSYLLIAYHQLHTFPKPEVRFHQEWGDGVCDY